MRKPAVKPKKPRKSPKPRAAIRVLAKDEAPPFRIENPKGKGAGLIVCDHASNRVPRGLKNMGVSKADLQKHIAWDIGAEDASRHISKKLDMPAVYASYSRLLVDLNRAPHHAECMVEVSDNIKVPANARLSREARVRRLKEIFWPYQNKIGKEIDRLLKRKQIPILLAIHSLTPEMNGVKRPWHISILWHKEEKIAKKLVAAIRKNHRDLLVGENEPYTLFDERFAGSTICRHAEDRGLPYIFVEFRQDLIDTKEKAARWADIFLEALKPLLESPEVLSGRKVRPLKKQD